MQRVGCTSFRRLRSTSLSEKNKKNEKINSWWHRPQKMNWKGPQRWWRSSGGDGRSGAGARPAGSENYLRGAHSSPRLFCPLDLEQIPRGHWVSLGPLFYLWPVTHFRPSALISAPLKSNRWWPTYRLPTNAPRCLVNLQPFTLIANYPEKLFSFVQQEYISPMTAQSIWCEI